MNLKTGTMNTQFHAVYDDLFHTVYSSKENIQNFWGNNVE